MYLIALVVATVIPLVVLFVIRALDLYQTGDFRTVLGSIAWGGVAFVGAYFLNTAIYDNSPIREWETVARFVAPPVEEILKVLVLVYLVRRANFTYFVDGAIYGFAAGVGFAVLENYQYILGAQDAAFGAAIGRVISTNLIHGCATALSGISIGLARFEKGPRRGLVMLGGLAAAILLHGAFNNAVALITGGPVLLIATVIALAAVALIVVLIFRGLAQSRRWIEAKLGAAAGDTMQEARVVRRLEDVQELLKPLRDMFGEKKLPEIEALLMAQARLGIQRAALEKLPDERMQQATRKEIAELTERINRLRISIGAYTMLAVRQIIPENNSPLWDILRNRIQERIEARPATGGANLFASLGQRLAGAQAENAASPDGAVAGSEAAPAGAPLKPPAVNPLAALQARMAAGGAASPGPTPGGAANTTPAAPAGPSPAQNPSETPGLDPAADKGAS